MLKINKPKFWDSKIGLFSIILFPLSLVYIFIIFLRKRFIKTQKFNIPVICVGNIYLGGTGKTPASILLANELTRIGRKPVILRKHYAKHQDEYNLIKNKFEDLIVNKNRVNGLIEAEKNGFKTVILDDGLQDFKIKKDIKIVCFSRQLIGNGLVMPSGPLRENLSSLRDADIVLINGNKNKNFENKLLNINKIIKIFYSLYEPINLKQFDNKKLLAIAAIGNPENFFQLIENNNLIIQKKLIFPDHYMFSKKEMQKIVDDAKKEGYTIIMTEKDYFKINNYKLENINYLKISLKIYEMEKFINSISSFYDKKS